MHSEVVMLVFIVTIFPLNVMGGEKSSSLDIRSGGLKSSLKVDFLSRERNARSRVDDNNDGFIDRSEYMANAEKRFKRLDSNGDGLITRRESREGHKAMRKEYGAFSKKKK